MAINVYGRKIIENEEKAVYSYGSNFENLTGKLQIIKQNLELQKIEESKDGLDNIAYFKIGCKAIKNYSKNGKFPDFLDSIS